MRVFIDRRADRLFVEAISNKMIDRIFSGAVSKYEHPFSSDTELVRFSFCSSQNMKEGKMSYYEFVWFLISEEDKRSPTR